VLTAGEDKMNNFEYNEDNAPSRAGRSNLVIAALAAALLAAVGFIVYQNFIGRRKPAPTASRPSPVAGAGSDAAFASFLASLPKGGDATKEAHRQLFSYMRSLDARSFPSGQVLKQLTDKAAIPHDYEFFFKGCLPAYSDSLKNGGRIFKDKGILLSLPEGANYRAGLLINKDNLRAEDMGQLVDVKGSANRLVVSGTYTSPFNMPAGLTIDKGDIINPAIQKFDGLLLISLDGKMLLTHVDDLQVKLRSLRIRDSFPNYVEFTDLAATEKLSAIQLFLLINAGEITFEDGPGQEKMRRRVLFQTADNGLHIYDSLSTPLTLYEAAKYVKENYKAVKAGSLETGVYNFCSLYSGGRLIDCSELKKGVILSNLLVIDY
jgi:hypothetical protein